MAICCLGEQQGFIKSGDFHGGASHSRLQWKTFFLPMVLPSSSLVLVDLNVVFVILMKAKLNYPALFTDHSLSLAFPVCR